MSTPDNKDEAITSMEAESQVSVSRKKKRTSAKKALQRSHKILKKAKEKKQDLGKEEKKAAKRLADAEKHLARANLQKHKAEEAVKKVAARKQAAIEAFESAKAGYDALKTSSQDTGKSKSAAKRGKAEKKTRATKSSSKETQVNA